VTANFEETVRTLVRARHPILWLVTHEERRSLRIVEAVAKDPRPGKSDPPKTLYVWTATDGMRKVENGKAGDSVSGADGEPINDPNLAIAFAMTSPEKNGAIYVLRDLHVFLGEGKPTYRVLRDAAAALKASKKTIVVTSPVARIPVELEKEIVLVDVPLPDAEALGTVLDSALASFEDDARVEKPKNGERERAIRAGLGLTEDEFLSAVLESVVRVRKVDPVLVVKSKEQIVRKAGIEFADASSGMADVGGLENLKSWIQSRALAFSTKAAKYGLRAPRGLFLTGPPGTGKSLTARAAANFLGFPILRVSADAIFGKYVGESEGNLARILKTAEAVAPSVLYVDEIEKLAAGSKGGDSGDSGVARRVLGQLLSWLQDHEAPVLLVATANDPLSVPPELVSRFDALFFVDMPSETERLEILEIHLRRKGRDPAKVGTRGTPLSIVAEAMEGFSGREIERVVNEALYLAFADGEREPVPADLVAVAKRIRPLSVSRKSEIDAMRRWARENAIPASARTEVAESPVSAAEV